MQKTRLKQYARLIARMGCNVQKGQDVFLEAELDVCRLLQRVGARIQSGVDVRIPRV